MSCTRHQKSPVVVRMVFISNIFQYQLYCLSIINYNGNSTTFDEDNQDIKIIVQTQIV